MVGGSTKRVPDLKQREWKNEQRSCMLGRRGGKDYILLHRLLKIKKEKSCEGRKSTDGHWPIYGRGFTFISVQDSKRMSYKTTDVGKGM